MKSLKSNNTKSSTKKESQKARIVHIGIQACHMFSEEDIAEFLAGEK